MATVATLQPGEAGQSADQDPLIPEPLQNGGLQFPHDKGNIGHQRLHEWRAVADLGGPRIFEHIFPTRHPIKGTSKNRNLP
jgi:hypothetical protein